MHLLTADTTVVKSHGQMHSKFWLLRFVSVDEQQQEVVRLVVSSGNVGPGSFGGMPEHRQLVGLWWADFQRRILEHLVRRIPTALPPSPFKAALLDHVEALLYAPHVCSNPAQARTPTLTAKRPSAPHMLSGGGLSGQSLQAVSRRRLPRQPRGGDRALAAAA